MRCLEKKKILFVVEAMGGGVFTYIVDLSNELVNKFDMYIAYGVRPQTPKDYRRYFDDRIHLIEVHNFGRSINIGKDVKAFFEIKKVAEKVSPDVIHLHSSKAGALGRWAFNGKKTPLFYTPHGYSFLMKNHSAVKRLIYRIVESVSAKRCCTTISCSEGEHHETLKLTKRAIYINNGINTNDLEKLIVSVPIPEEQQFTVFTLGRICYQKNPSLFNEIAEALPDVHFLWIGDGELRGELKAENIEITGWMDREKALSRSLSADVFVLTSLWEGLPISLLEAMYMKKLCVVSDVIGNHDVIHNGQNGYVCKDKNAFVEAIKTAMNGGCESLTSVAYENILSEYNALAMAKKYSKIYREAITGVLM